MFKISIYIKEEWEVIDEIDAVDVDNENGTFLFYDGSGSLMSIYKSADQFVKIESK